MSRTLVAMAATALVGATWMASASEITGKISFIDPAANAITLDDGQTFKLATPEEAAMLMIGEKVRITFTDSGSEKVASAVEPAF